MLLKSKSSSCADEIVYGLSFLQGATMFFVDHYILVVPVLSLLELPKLNFLE